MLKMEPSRFLQVPGWEHFAQHDVKPVECSCKLSNGYNNNNNSNSTITTNNNNNISCSNIELTINGKYCCCSDFSNDKYTAAIDLSNKCREFYNSRLEAANTIRSRWGVSHCDNISTQTSPSSSSSSPTHTPQTLSSSSASSSSSPTSSSPPVSPSSSTSSLTGSNSSNSSCSKEHDDQMTSSDTGKSRPRNSIDLAMNRLRSEMMSLMDQDLSLMKQLLTLNETIEELKWQRQYYSCSNSCASLSPSGHFQARTGYGGSNWSVSDTEMYESEDDLNLARAGSVRSATATTVGAVGVKTTTPSSSSVTPRSASTASLAMTQQHHNQLAVPTWQSTRKARKSSSDFDQISLDDSLSPRLGCDDDGEVGLAAEVQAALRKMDISAGRHGDSAIFPSAFVDTYRKRPVLSAEQRNQKDGKHKRESVSYKVTSPGCVGKHFQFTSDHLDLTPGPIIRHDRDQHSFDSGIHEPALSEEIVWNV